MRANQSPMDVVDYCQGLESRTIVVNEEYQRGEGIWSTRARSYFIETIILQYPIPKMFLFTRLDLETNYNIKEIVDGQQRSRVLHQFFKNRMTLSKNIETEELRGKKFKDLDSELRTQFLTYSLPIDQFSGVQEADVREAFRRMNANNVPLNDQEQRNATYQGPFKWFVLELAKRYREVFRSIKLFSNRDVIRMIDARVISEILSGMDEGFITLKAAQLNRLYARYNVSFPYENEYGYRVNEAFDWFVRRTDLHFKPFLRPHVFQSIILAYIDYRFEIGLLDDALEKLNGAPTIGSGVSFELLLRTLDDPESFPELEEFVDACSRRTNVAATRALRFRYLRACFEDKE